MSTIATTSTVKPTASGGAPRRRPVGGLNPTFLRIELRRLVRNRRTVMFSLVMPPVFFLIFGTAARYKTMSAGNGNVTAYIMISMAVYGAMLATTSGGAMVSVERALGWSRQLRLTPLSPVAYILTKVVVAMALGLASVVVVYLIGSINGAHADNAVWIESALVAWLGSSVFAAFGLFMGYLLPAENVMQILGPILAVLAFAGGLFVPLTDGLFATIAKFTPLYGLAELSRAPLGDSGWSLTAIVNLVAWAVVFVTGATVMFRRDTARV
jgi:ABC-2 type transport system permease protein